MPTKPRTTTVILVAVEVDTLDESVARRQVNTFLNRGLSFPIKASKLVTSAKVIAPNPFQEEV